MDPETHPEGNCLRHGHLLSLSKLMKIVHIDQLLNLGMSLSQVFISNKCHQTVSNNMSAFINDSKSNWMSTGQYTSIFKNPIATSDFNFMLTVSYLKYLRVFTDSDLSLGEHFDDITWRAYQRSIWFIHQIHWIELTVLGMAYLSLLLIFETSSNVLLYYLYVQV